MNSHQDQTGEREEEEQDDMGAVRDATGECVCHVALLLVVMEVGIDRGLSDVDLR